MSDIERDPVLERARRTYRRLQERVPADAPPTDEQLADLVLGNLEGDARRRVADAVVASPELAARVRELMEVHRLSATGLDLPSGPAGDRPAAAARAFRPLLAAAAVLIAVVGLGYWSLQPGGPFGGSGSAGALRGEGADFALAVQPDDGALLPDAPRTLRWTAVPGASSYRAVLYDFESSVLWQSEETPAVEVAIPADVRAAINPREDYFWRVVYRAGIDERRTPLRRFRVEP